MRLILLAGALFASAANATFVVCSPIPDGAPGCNYAWTCPCPGEDGSCTYSPGHTGACGCPGTPGLIKGLWYCPQTLGVSCEKPDNLCVAGEIDIANAVEVYVNTQGELGPEPDVACSAALHDNPLCTTSQYCNPNVACCAPLIGDPISVKDSVSVDEIEDVRVPTALGDLTFIRRFTQSPHAYSYLQVGMMGRRPFGTDPATNSTMHWTHNWHSIIRYEKPDDASVPPVPGEFAVLDPSGMVSLFPVCGSDCYAGTNAVTGDMLYVEANKLTLLVRVHGGIDTDRRV